MGTPTRLLTREQQILTESTVYPSGVFVRMGRFLLMHAGARYVPVGTSKKMTLRYNLVRSLGKEFLIQLGNAPKQSFRCWIVNCFIVL